MVTKLAEWYKILSIPNLTGEMIDNRSSIIKKTAKSKDSDWFHECIRLFLGKKLVNENFTTEFAGLFQENDSLFTQKDNDLEMQLLAGAFLVELIENSKNKEKLEISLALKSASFGIKEMPRTTTEILVLNDSYLNSESIKNRQVEDKKPSINLTFDTNVVAPPSVENISAKFALVNEQLQKVTQQLNERNEHYSKRIEVLEEESNIHWWIFRSQSETANCANKALGKAVAPLVISIDLARLSNVLPFPVNFRQFLDRVLTDAHGIQDFEITIKDCINDLMPFFKSIGNIQYAENLGAICPILSGCLLAEKAGDKDGWTAFFKTLTEVDPASSEKSLDVASQIFIECMLLKAN